LLTPSNGFSILAVDPGGNMRNMICFLFLCVMLAWAADKSVYDYTLNSIDGQAASFGAYKGKVLMVVNVASRCGYTPQYSALESVYEKYKDRGFVIVGVPANNFGAQEPGTNEEIKTFCTRKYNVQFPMMSKVSVKGADTTPLYQYLTDASLHPKTGGEIKWNFTKFLVDRNGNMVARFEPDVTPDAPPVIAAIEKALAH
jgi:glutathione peroxidase